METMTTSMVEGVAQRLSVIEMRARFEKGIGGGLRVFSAKRLKDVLVNEDFSTGMSALQGEAATLGPLIDGMVSAAETSDLRRFYFLGLKADLEGNSRLALEQFQQAATLLQAERSTLFDPRHRGTIIENRADLVRDLAIRLLARRQLDDAFLAFEAIRARGLNELASAFAGGQFTKAERTWLGDLVQADSEQSLILVDLVATTIAGVEHSKASAMLERLAQLRNQRRMLLDQPDYRQTASRLAATSYSPVTLAELTKTSQATGIPVILYWVTNSNIIVWVVSGGKSEVKTVFLPEPALIQKVDRLVASLQTGEPGTFAQDTAQELHTYLIKPFAKYFLKPQVLIVPQGPLVALPFEALVDPQNGAFLIEQTAVSYAPSGSFAARALRAPTPTLSEVLAIYDEELEASSHEIYRVARANGSMHVVAKPSNGLTPEAAVGLFGESANVHLLLHGRFSEQDPLQSHLNLGESTLSGLGYQITAAKLLAVDWWNVRLAVFSACQGAALDARISNELFGLSWAPLAGGASHVLLNRWRVNEESNAKWMEAFYASLGAAGKIYPARAASMAMRKMIGPERRHPYHWAGPQLFGR